MSATPHIVLGVVTCPRGVLLVHRPEQIPPAFFPGATPEAGEQPSDTVERGVREEARLRVRAGKVIGKHPHPTQKRPVVYLAATPKDDLTGDTMALSLRVGWYTLEQVGLVLPDLHPPVFDHLAATIPGGDGSDT